jgi:hypothetical protein
MKIEVSNGEILDKISILMIKLERISDKEKKKNISKELEQLKSTFDLKDPTILDFLKSLKRVNEVLWDAEDKIRLKEDKLLFDKEFISLARMVYINNDARAFIKKVINEKTNSDLIEEKSYAIEKERYEQHKK